MSMLSRFATFGGGGDPYWNNVSYLLVGNGANGTTTNIKDSSNNNLTTTIAGNTVISTAQSKFGSGSVYFDGTGGYLTLPSSALFNFGTGDFTIEFWYYHVSKTAGAPQIIGNTLAWGANAWGLIVAHDWAPGKFSLFCYNMSSSGTTLVSTTSVSTNTWYYIALGRNSNTLNLYINGALESTATNSIALTSSDASEIIGNTAAMNGSINGYLYDLRVTKGVARYTGSTMTVPTAPLPIG